MVNKAVIGMIVVVLLATLGFGALLASQDGGDVGAAEAPDTGENATDEAAAVAPGGTVTDGAPASETTQPVLQAPATL